MNGSVYASVRWRRAVAGVLSLWCVGAAVSAQPVGTEHEAHASACADPDSAVGRNRLTTRDILVRVLEADPLIAASALNVAAAGDGIDVARAGRYPTVQWSADEGRIDRQNQRADLGNSDEAHSRGVHVVSLTQTLFDGHRTTAQIREAEQRREQEQVRSFKTINERMLATLEAMHTLVVERRKLRLARTTRDQLDRLVQVTSARVQAGQDALIGLRRADARLIEARRGVADSAASCEQAAARFTALTRLAASQFADPELGFQPIRAGEVQRMAGLCASQCPDVQDSLLDLERGRTELAMQKAERFPVVSLEVSAGSYKNSQGLVERYRNYSAGVRASWTLYSGGSTSAKEQQISRNVLALEQRVEEARRKASDDFTANMIQYESVITMYDLAESARMVTQEARLLSERGFLAGVRSAIELADTIEEENRNANSSLSLSAQRFVAMYGLYAKVGELPRLFDITTH